MLEALATLILSLVGALLMIAVLAYGIYITFYPLSETVKGAVEAVKELHEREGKELPRTPPIPGFIEETE